METGKRASVKVPQEETQADKADFWPSSSPPRSAASARMPCCSAAKGRVCRLGCQERPQYKKHLLKLGTVLKTSVNIYVVCVCVQACRYTHTLSSFQNCSKNNQRHCYLSFSLLPSQRQAPVVPQHIHNRFSGKRKGKRICTTDINKTKIQINEGLISSTL